MERYGGELPRSYEELLTLPGIGPYTAGAIASIALWNSGASGGWERSARCPPA